MIHDMIKQLDLTFMEEEILENLDPEMVGLYLHQLATGEKLNTNWYGSRNNKAVLTYKQVVAIKNSTKPYRKIAEEFGITSGTVSNIKNNKYWKHVGNKSVKEPHLDRPKSRGEGNPFSKLTEENVIFILKNKDRYTTAYFAETFNVNAATIRSIIRRDTWGHVKYE